VDGDVNTLICVVAFLGLRHGQPVLRVGLRLMPRHLIGTPTQRRKYEAAQLASSVRNSEMSSGGFPSGRDNAAQADFMPAPIYPSGELIFPA
jgi:hypothetical protein